MKKSLLFLPLESLRSRHSESLQTRTQPVITRVLQSLVSCDIFHDLSPPGPKPGKLAEPVFWIEPGRKRLDVAGEPDCEWSGRDWPFCRQQKVGGRAIAAPLTQHQ